MRAVPPPRQEDAKTSAYVSNRPRAERIPCMNAFLQGGSSGTNARARAARRGWTL